MLSHDLAELYGVAVKALNQAVKRKINRFPGDFMFQLTEREKQQVVTNCDHLQNLKYSRYPPFAFTEQGVAMLSYVLNSDRAVRVNIEIVRAFVRLRRLLVSNDHLATQLRRLERKCDVQFKAVFEILDRLMSSPVSPKRRIGFDSDD